MDTCLRACPCMATFLNNTLHIHNSLFHQSFTTTINTSPSSISNSSSKHICVVKKQRRKKMAMKSKLFSIFLLFSLSLLCLSLVVAKQDPELKQCKHQCRVQQQIGERQKEQCEQRCEDYYRQKQEREREERGEREQEEGGNPDPEREFHQCREKCQQQEQGHKQEQTCEKRCVERWREEKEREKEREREHGGGKNIREREEEEEEREEKENPYVFEERHFSSRFKTEHGRIRTLQKFTEKSKLLKGIENYRVEILEANPNTFTIPKHVDAEGLYAVLKGRGTIALIRDNKRESFNVRPGDLLRIHAGTPIYIINRDDNEKLFVAKLFQPVATPGEYEVFWEAGGNNPESFYKAFSTELLEAALKTKRDKLERVFGQQKQGVVIKATKEQIRALSQHEEGGIWPFGGETKSERPFNLFDKRPSISNQYGRLHEVNPNDCKELRELDLEVNFANITKGAMAGPSFISKATKIALVIDGEGYFEMACPHLSKGRQQGGRGRSQEREETTRYQKVSSRLKCGTVFVVPAGHPVAVVASNNKNLQIICFDVNAQNNQKYSLAGKKNVINLLEKEAKELAFGVSAREVDQVFGNNDEEFFFAGPRQQQEREHRAYA